MKEAENVLKNKFEIKSLKGVRLYCVINLISFKNVSSRLSNARLDIF